MSTESAELCTAFAKYVLSSGKVPELETLKRDVEYSVKESHEFLREIRALCSSANTATENLDETRNSVDDLARHEEISKFLASAPPRLLLSDMDHLYELELDTEVTIAKTAAVLEKLRNNKLALPTDPVKNNFNFSSDLTDYATCLEQFGKKLTYFINTIECDKEFQRDLELERKLQSLCDDIEMFWKMVQAKMKISQSKEKVPQIENSGAFCHIEPIKKLVGTINEVTFLMQNNN